MTKKYDVVVFDDFEKKFVKLDYSIRKKFKKKFSSLATNPYHLGKPLSFPWFRELKVDKFRLYYAISDDILIVLFITLSQKKDQSEIISKIKEILPDLLFFLRVNKKKFKSLE